MTETNDRAPTIEETLTELDNEIQEDRKSLAKWKRWKKHAGFVMGVSTAVCLLLATRIPVIGLVAVPAFIASTTAYVICRIRHKNCEEELNEKYNEQAKLLTAIEAARSGPGSELKLAALAKEFSQASRLSKLEKTVEELTAKLKDVLDGDDDNNKGLDKSAPAKSGIKL